MALHKRNEMLDTLRITKWLSEDNLSAVTMSKALGIKTTTVKRYINEAVHLGARIDLIQNSYYLMNWPNIEKTVLKWIELEEKRNFRE